MRHQCDTVIILKVYTNTNNPRLKASLVVGHFSVNYVGKEHAGHLVSVIKENYGVTDNWEGKQHLGLTFDWDYKEHN